MLYTEFTTETNGEYVNITNDIKCEVYSPEQVKDSTETSSHSIHKSLEEGKK